MSIAQSLQSTLVLPSPVCTHPPTISPAIGKFLPTEAFGSGLGGTSQNNSNDLNLKTDKRFVTEPAALGEKENTPTGGSLAEVQQVEGQRGPVLARRPDSAKLLNILNSDSTTADATPAVHNSNSILPRTGFDANAEYSYAPETWLAETPRLERLGLARHSDPNASWNSLNASYGGIALADHSYAYNAEAGGAPFSFIPFAEDANQAEAGFKFDPFAEDDNDLAEAEMFEWPDTIGFLYGDDDSLHWSPVIKPHAKDQDALAQEDEDWDNEFIIRYFGADPLSPPETWSRYTPDSPYRRTSMTPLTLADVGTGAPGEPTFWDFWFSLPPLSTTLPFLFGFESEGEGPGPGRAQYEWQGQGANGAAGNQSEPRYYRYYPAPVAYHGSWTGTPERGASWSVLSEGEKWMDISASDLPAMNIERENARYIDSETAAFIPMSL